MFHNLQRMLVVIEPQDLLCFPADQHRHRLDLRLNPFQCLGQTLLIRKKEANLARLFICLGTRHFQMIHDLHRMCVVIDPQELLRLQTQKHRHGLQLRLNPF